MNYNRKGHRVRRNLELGGRLCGKPFLAQTGADLAKHCISHLRDCWLQNTILKGGTDQRHFLPILHSAEELADWNTYASL
jgi:hypothetical protein